MLAFEFQGQQQAGCVLAGVIVQLSVGESANCYQADFIPN
jgi:hypothetical protein